MLILVQYCYYTVPDPPKGYEIQQIIPKDIGAQSHRA